MAYSKITVPGDGVTTLLPVNFTLGVDPGQFTCRVGNEVDGAGNPAYRAVTKQPSGLYQVSGPPAPVGSFYLFERNATVDELDVDWSNGDPITKTNLNKAQKQAIMLAHQALDGRIDPSQDINFKNTWRVRGLPAAVKDGDAVVYEQYSLLLDMLQAIPVTGITDLVDGGIYFPNTAGIGPNVDGGDF